MLEIHFSSGALQTATIAFDLHALQITCNRAQTRLFSLIAPWLCGLIVSVRPVMHAKLPGSVQGLCGGFTH